MITAVADTHAVIWYLVDDPRLSTSARDAFDTAIRSGQHIAVSSISLVEIVYLVEKSRIPTEAYPLLIRALADPQHAFVEIPVTAHLSKYLKLVSRIEVPDMPDRIIAATGLQLQVPIISCDRRIRAANLLSIW